MAIEFFYFPAKSRQTQILIGHEIYRSFCSRHSGFTTVFFFHKHRKFCAVVVRCTFTCLSILQSICKQAPRLNAKKYLSYAMPNIFVIKSKVIFWHHMWCNIKITHRHLIVDHSTKMFFSSIFIRYHSRIHIVYRRGKLRAYSSVTLW